LPSGKSGVIIEGTSGGGFKLVGTGNNGVALQMQNCTNCTVRNMAIDGNNVDFIPIFLLSGSGMLVTGNTLTNVGACLAGIYTEGNSGNTYSGNTINTTEITYGGGGEWIDATRGLWIGNDGGAETAPIIEGNTLINIGGTAIVFSGSNAIIRNNTGTLLSYSGVKAVSFSGDSGTTVIESNVLSGAGARTNERGEIYTDGRAGSGETYSIRYNSVTCGPTNSSGGAYITGGTFTGVIDNNTFTNCVGGITFEVVTSNSVMIRNNTVDYTVAGTFNDGISLWGYTGRSHTNFTIDHNDIRHADIMGLQLNTQGGTISNIAITNNIFSNNTNYGIQINNVSGTLTNVTASGNCFTGNGIASLYDSRGIISPPSQSSECHWRNTKNRSVAIF
jgi:hypothetical protein